MGFFIRKSKKLGLINLNLSKAGLGFSIGVKGCRLSFNKKGVQLNAGRGGLYFRKSLTSKKTQKNAQAYDEELNEQNESCIKKPCKQKTKIITKTPEQEYFEFYLSGFTLLFLIGFIGLFLKFSAACLLLFFAAIARVLYINKNSEKYALYKQNPDPQCYYIGHFKSQIEELKRQADEQNKRIDEPTKRGNQ